MKAAGYNGATVVVTLLALSVTICAQVLQTSRITAFAGTGAPGSVGDGGVATSAQLNEPFHCAFDSQGTLYIADMANHKIRRVGRNGVITTVVGTGTAGAKGDGGPATEAELHEPYGVALDSWDNLYIVDRLNAKIRRVDRATGVITTLAGTGVRGSSEDGGPAGSAQLNEPNGIAIDSKDRLYIADVSANRIRVVDLRTRLISTIAGTGVRARTGDAGPAALAGINGARAVAVWRDEIVYICEREGNAIRKVDLESGIITPFAGTGKAGYTGDGGRAIEAAFNGPKWISLDAPGNLYVVDTENHCVRRIDARTGIITTVAGNGRKGSTGDGKSALAAMLDRPHGCTVRGGKLYIADSNNHRIRVTSVPP